MSTENRMHLTMHKYWHRKSHFALNQDIYEDWTIFAVEEGSFNYTIDGNSGIAGPGEIVVCPPEIWFGREVLETLSFHFLHFQFNSASEDPTFPFERQIHRFKDRLRYDSTLRMLKNSEFTATKQGDLCKEHLLEDLRIQLEFEEQFHVLIKPEEKDPLIEKAYHLLEKQFDHELQLRSLAQTLELTPVQFTRRFHAAYGMTPSDFVIDLRLKQACRMLVETNLTIDQIAQNNGYESGFYLSRIFLKKMKLRPSEYRKRYQV